MKLTKYGKREWLGAGVIAVVPFILLILLAIFNIIPAAAAIVLCLFIFLIWGAVAAFFRDPERKIPSAEEVIVSPADGVIRDIELIKSESIECEELRELFAGHDMLRIGIFLSVFNVHLNRAPAPMKALFTFYKKGAFHDARDGRASKENESMIMGGMATYKDVIYPIAVKQVSGAIARRIVCPVKKDDVFEKGQRYGMIKFGSRTELYLPAGQIFNVKVHVGEAVSGGVSVLAEIMPGGYDELRQANTQKAQKESDPALNGEASLS